MGDTVFNRTNAGDYLKRTYGPAGVVIFNSRTPTLKRIPKVTKPYIGERFEEVVEFSIGVGVGCGEEYPDAGVEKTGKVFLGAKRTYAVGVIDRMLSRTAVGGETAFIDSKKHKYKRVQEGYAWNWERFLWTRSTEGLGTVDAVTAADPNYTVSITADSWRRYQFEIGTKVNFGASLEKFTITNVDYDNRIIYTQRDTAGVTTPTAGDVIYMQNSKDAEPVSIPDVCRATSGTLYGLEVGTAGKWKAHQQLDVDQTMDEELLDNAVLDLQDKTGATESDTTTDIVMHNTAWKSLKAKAVGLKMYNFPNMQVPKKYEAVFGLNALAYTSPVSLGLVPIYTSRFIHTDEVFGLNMNRARILQVHAPMFFDDDGGVLRKTPDRKDHWEFVFGTYAEHFMYPDYQFYISGVN